MTPMRGLLAYGAYVPYARLDRKSIAEALGAPAGSGTRAVAAYDEDTTSMGVEAARSALRGVRTTPELLYFATADPAYLDKTNANAIHAALDLPPATMAVDVTGSVRSAAGALRAALDARAPALAVLSDIRSGLPGGGDEKEGGDADRRRLGRHRVLRRRRGRCGGGEAEVPGDLSLGRDRRVDPEGALGEGEAASSEPHTARLSGRSRIPL